MSHLSHSPLIADQILNESETESLKTSMKYHVKYGSTGCDHKSVNKYKYVSHSVQSTDTLQGLALKYGTTMETIKRANNLWSSDSLSLRSRTVISIPVLLNETAIESPVYSSSNTSSQTTSPKESELNNGSNPSMTANNSSLESVDIPLDDDQQCSSGRLDSNSMQTNGSNGKLKNGFKSTSLLVSSDEQTNDLDSYADIEGTDESAADFLIRIDSSIAKSKDKVKDMQQNNRLSGTHSDDDLFRMNYSSQKSNLRRHHSSTSRPHSANSSSNVTQTQNDFPQPLVVLTHKRKVKSSLKRLQQTQDEIFEL